MLDSGGQFMRPLLRISDAIDRPLPGLNFDEPKQ